MQAIHAVCKYPAKTYTTKYGDRLNAVFTTAAGDEYKVWGSVDHQGLTAVERGETYLLTIDSKGNARLLEGEIEQAQPAPVDPQEDPELARKKEILSYTEKLAKLYSFCYRRATAELSDMPELDSSDYRAIATTIFIQTVKHFDL